MAEHRVRLNVSVTFDDRKEALDVYRALKVDDDDFIRTMMEDATVVAEVKGPTIDSVRRAADDWMACLMSVRKC